MLCCIRNLCLRNQIEKSILSPNLPHSEGMGLPAPAITLWRCGKQGNKGKLKESLVQLQNPLDWTECVMEGQ